MADYVNVVVKIRDGRTPMQSYISKMLTNDSMGVYIGLQKIFRAYYSNRLLTIEIPHNYDYKLSDVVKFATGFPEIDTYWQIISKSTNIKFGKIIDTITLQSKRSEKRR